MFNIIVDSKDITKDNVENIFKVNGFKFKTPYTLENIFSSLSNCTMIISLWKNSELFGYCSILSDKVYFGRIQEFILHPDIKEDDQYLNEIVKRLFDELPSIKSFHMNPNVFEKKLIYTKRQSNRCPILKKIYWSIHEDEY